jgi:autophagy-related protein 9
MASHMFSKLLPGGTGPSFYEDLRNRHDTSDIEDRAGLLDEENLNQDFHDYDLDQVEGLAVDDSRISVAPSKMQSRRGGPSSRRAHKETGYNKWFGGHGHDDDGDNDVPASLLVEPHDMVDATSGGQRRKPGIHGRAPPIPGPSTRTTRAHWETTQNQQRLHHDDSSAGAHHPPRPGAFLASALNGDAKKKAEWRWANVSNLDYFMHDVYSYYRGCGFWCILLERLLHLV